MGLIYFVFLTFVRAGDPADLDYRDLILENAGPNINKLIEKYFDRAIQAENRENKKSCEGSKGWNGILRKLSYILDTNFPDVVEDLIDQNAPMQYVSPKESSYQGFVSPNYNGCCMPTLRIGKSLTGLDKVDHFLSHGYFYYENFLKFKDENGVLKLGQKQEEGGWGLSGTGVKSYGDLAANYSGFLFWKEILDGPNPFLICTSGHWSRSPRSFKIEDYADDSWDEGINCSSVNSKKNSDLFAANVQAKKETLCPVDLKKCEALSRKLPEHVQATLLSPRCRNQIRGSPLVEEPKLMSAEEMHPFFAGAGWRIIYQGWLQLFPEAHFSKQQIKKEDGKK